MGASCEQVSETKHPRGIEGREAATQLTQKRTANLTCMTACMRCACVHPFVSVCMRMRMAACGLRVPASLHGMFLRVHPSLRLLLEVWMKIRVQGCRDACPALRMDTAWYQGKQGSFCKTRTIFHTWLQPLDLCTVVSQDCSVQGGRKHLESVLCGCQGAWGRQAQLQVTALHPLTLRAGSHTSSSVPHAPTHTREQADTGAHGGV
jgi:hypothetical protein